MMKFKFEDLRVYREAVDFANIVFTMTKRWPVLYRFSLADQFQRAVLSIALNIAEGTSRTSRDFAHFLSVSRGSCYECVPILTIALKQKLLNQKEYESLYDTVNYLARMLTALRESIAPPSK